VMSVTISTWKRCSVRLCLQLFVGDSCLVSLFVLYLLALDAVQRVLCRVLGFFSSPFVPYVASFS
jgi:uncharacterized membrane protein YedE/YeeE